MATVRSKAAAEEEKKKNELITNLKFKVKELDDEVTRLKSRLDELRKAKNTTITKREREVLEVGFPRRDPKYEAEIAKLQKQLHDANQRHQANVEELSKKFAAELEEMEQSKHATIEELKRKHALAMEALKDKTQAEIADLKKKHAAELAAARKKQIDMEKELDELRKKLAAEIKDMEARLLKEQQESLSGHEYELIELRRRIRELEADNTALLMGNGELRERATALVTDLSIKEAKWCEAEEQMKYKEKEGWGEKYAQWMSDTERKIQDLEQTNQLLRQYLHNSGRRDQSPDPDGRNPGGQNGASYGSL